MFPTAASEPVTAGRNMAPVSSPVKQSYVDTPDIPESIPSGGKYLSSISDVEIPFSNG